MRIGILTYHRAYNYGAFMQTYALVQQLKKQFTGDIIEVIDFSYRYNIINHRKKNLKMLFRFGPVPFLHERKIQRSFTKWLNKIPLGERIITDDTNLAIKKICSVYDFVIVGSDAVFNWTINPLPNIYFFNTSDCPHVSYAASAHLNRYKTIPDRERFFVKEALNKFLYIGVRDKETENFVNYFDGALCNHNCDPTVRLEFDYGTPELEKKLIKKGIDVTKPFICVMLKREDYGKWIKEVFKNKYCIVAVRKRNRYSDYFLDELDPFEWSRIFSYAKITITDFFHGSLLSLKNGTPVLSIDSSNYNGEYESKAKDLFLTRLRIPEFYFEGISEVEFKNRCVSIEAGDYRERINYALEREGLSFDRFCDELRKLLSCLQKVKETT